MKVTITAANGEAVAEHDVNQQTAAYLGHAIDPDELPAPDPETQPEDADADEIVDDIATACRNEINDPRHGAATPYENPRKRPNWAAARP